MFHFIYTQCMWDSPLSSGPVYIAAFSTFFDALVATHVTAHDLSITGSNFSYMALFAQMS